MTFEIAREPAVGEDFGWRLSLATIARDGAFSTYSGYRRAIALVDGAGFHLKIGAAAPVRLGHAGASTRFSGDSLTECELTDGPSTDISLIVREPGEIDAVDCLTVSQTVPLISDAKRLAVFCLRGSLACTVRDSLPDRLGRLDTLLFTKSPDRLELTRQSSDPAQVLMLRWRAAGD